MFGRIEQVERLSPHMVRIVLGGEGLAGFRAVPWTDAYLNVYFPPPGAPYGVPFDVVAATSLPPGQRPASRRYSVRAWDAARRRLTLDIVAHDSGVAGPWAKAAQPGQLVQFSGPRGTYHPNPDADWHLMIGDESALPAIAASLERVPAGRPVHVLLEVGGPADELPLDSPGELHLKWLHRDAHPGADDLALRALDGFERPPGRVHAFVHGEAVANRALRKRLLGDWAIPRQDVSISPYWRRTFSEESWRAIKKVWLSEIEQDL